MRRMSRSGRRRWRRRKRRNVLGGRSGGRRWLRGRKPASFLHGPRSAVGSPLTSHSLIAFAMVIHLNTQLESIATSCRGAQVNCLPNVFLLFSFVQFLEEMRRGATVKMPPYPSVSSPEAFTGTDVDDKASVSSHEGDNPLEITGEWSDDIETIRLQKGPEGLGFSLMHYKVCYYLWKYLIANYVCYYY